MANCSHYSEWRYVFVFSILGENIKEQVECFSLILTSCSYSRSDVHLGHISFAPLNVKQVESKLHIGWIIVDDVRRHYLFLIAFKGENFED